jgi:p-aminobenzoyl-glutamate transporter AbgT
VYGNYTDIGIVTTMLLPYSVTFLVEWTASALLYQAAGVPSGQQASYDK